MSRKDLPKNMEMAIIAISIFFECRIFSKLMKSVNVAQLKDGLSGYLKLVRAGEEIVIRDRQTPIARLMPLSNVDAIDDEMKALAASGKMRLPSQPFDIKIFPKSAPKVSTKIIVEALRQDRDED
jgi:antitoxin (DNA-binding transcriptional repressor) of toxin-antitoxin stability system